jgi:hypothetical protein
MAEVLILNPSGKKIKNPKPTNLTKGGHMKRGKHYKADRNISKNSYIAGRQYLNPGVYPMYRPSLFSRMVSNPVGAVTRSLVHPIHKDSVQTLVAGAVGAFGTSMIPTRKFIEMIPFVNKIPVLPMVLGNIVNMTILATATKMITKKDEWAKGVLVGGIIVTGIQIVAGVAKAAPNIVALQKVSSSITMAGLGNDKETVRKALEERIRKELSGPAAESSYSTVKGLPYESSYSVAGLPAESSYSTVGGGDDLTEDTMDN